MTAGKRHPYSGFADRLTVTGMSIEEVDVVVVGAGQAGLSTSHELAALGVRHCVLERAEEICGSWADRWDSFCLVTPNHVIALPGGEYSGPQPDGYLARDAIVEHLARYAESFGAPVRTGVEVTDLAPRQDGRVALTLKEGDVIVAREVVVASGGLRQAFRPPWVPALAGVPLFDVTQYRNPDTLPPGGVLVVGSGQSGCQLAEELIASGRRVVLSCGRAPWIPRRIDGRDTFDWLLETGFMEQTLADLPVGPAARLMPNPQASGRDGGHDLTTRTLQALGVELAGHVASVEDGMVLFAGDLADCVAFGDGRWAAMRDAIAGSQQARGRPVPRLPVPDPFDATEELARLALDEIGSVLLTCGFRPAYADWIDIPGALDPMGFPVQRDGRSTVVGGLSFVGVPFMSRRSSQLLLGVGRDAAPVARGVQAHLAAA